MTEPTAEWITGQFALLRTRSGLTLDNLAKLMGYRAASSIQRYEKPDEYSGGYFKREFVEKLAGALAGKGTPPITKAEVYRLAGPALGSTDSATTVGKSRAYTSFDPDAAWHPEPDFEGEAYTRGEWKPKEPGAFPEVDIKVGGGEGAVGEVLVLEISGRPYSGHRIIDEWSFPESFIHAAGTSVSQSIVAEVGGDSMLPTYLPGDRVVVDLSQNQLAVDGVYMWSDGFSAPQIKRMQRIPFTNPPRVKISSDNATYQPYEADVSAVKIFGKVTWHIGKR